MLGKFTRLIFIQYHYKQSQYTRADILLNAILQTAYFVFVCWIYQNDYFANNGPWDLICNHQMYKPWQNPVKRSVRKSMTSFEVKVVVFGSKISELNKEAYSFIRKFY